MALILGLLLSLQNAYGANFNGTQAQLQIEWMLAMRILG